MALDIPQQGHGIRKRTRYGQGMSKVQTAEMYTMAIISLTNAFFAMAYMSFLNGLFRFMSVRNGNPASIRQQLSAHR